MQLVQSNGNPALVRASSGLASPPSPVFLSDPTHCCAPSRPTSRPCHKCFTLTHKHARSFNLSKRFKSVSIYEWGPSLAATCTRPCVALQAFSMRAQTATRSTRSCVYILGCLFICSLARPYVHSLNAVRTRPHTNATKLTRTTHASSQELLESRQNGKPSTP